MGGHFASDMLTYQHWYLVNLGDDVWESIVGQTWKQRRRIKNLVDVE